MVSKRKSSGSKGRRTWHWPVEAVAGSLAFELSDGELVRFHYTPPFVDRGDNLDEVLVLNQPVLCSKETSARSEGRAAKQSPTAYLHRQDLSELHQEG